MHRGPGLATSIRVYKPSDSRELEDRKLSGRRAQPAHADYDAWKLNRRNAIVNENLQKRVLPNDMLGKL